MGKLLFILCLEKNRVNPLKHIMLMKKIYIIVFLAVLSATTAIAGNFERCQGKISRSAVRNHNFPEAVEDITPLSFRKQ